MKSFKESISLEIFPDNMKIAHNANFINRQKRAIISISMLPCFLKILERIICNRVSKYLDANNGLFQNQFIFREDHSISSALVVDFISSIYDSFNQNKFTLGVFIDISKAADKVDHNILLNREIKTIVL